MLDSTNCWGCAHFDYTTNKCKANAIRHFLELMECPWRIPAGMCIPEQLLDTVRKVIPCTIDGCPVGVMIHKFNNYPVEANLELYSVEFTVCGITHNIDVFMLTTNPEDNIHYLHRFNDVVSTLLEVVKREEGIYTDNPDRE